MIDLGKLLGEGPAIDEPVTDLQIVSALAELEAVRAGLEALRAAPAETRGRILVATTILHKGRVSAAAVRLFVEALERSRERPDHESEGR